MYAYNEWDKIVARQVTKDDGSIVFRAEPWTTCMDTPLTLFGYNKREVDMQEFVTWAKKRCFPEERVDKDEVLKSLGLTRYDPWEIVKITKGVIYAKDDFWIDFKHK